MKKSHIILILVIVIIIAAGLVVYGLVNVSMVGTQTQNPGMPAQNQATSTTGVTPPPQTSQPGQTSQIPADWKTYTNSQLGLSFQYPASLNSSYATLVSVSASATTTVGVDSNGCYISPELGGPQKAGATDSQVTINDIPFCLSSFGSPGAGQLYTDYYYTTNKGGTYITLDYTVHTPNGCGAFGDGASLEACQDFFSNDFNAVVTQPLQESVSTLVF